MPTLITRDYVVSKKRGFSAGTFYVSIIGSLEGESNTQDDPAMLMKRSGKLSKLRVYITDGGNPSATASVTLHKKPSGGAWGATSLTISNSGGSIGLFEDNTHEVTFASGDLLCWEIVSTTTFTNGFALRFIATRVEDQ